MTDHDRGAYTPQTDAPLSFDARRVPGGRPVPMTLMISGMVLVILLIGVVYFYRSGVRTPNAAPQVIGAPVGSTKAPPPPGEQPSDGAAGLQVYKSETAPLSQPQPQPAAAGAPSAAPKFTPAPEQPAPRPAPKAAPVPPPPVQTAPIRTAPVQTAPAKTAPAKAASAAPASAPVSVTPKTAAKPAPKPAAAPAASATASTSGPMVQIGAYSSAALADKGWNDTGQILPGQMTGKTKTVQVVQKDGKTFYRTSVGGFGSKAAAASFCASLKAAGRSCMVK